MAGPLWLTLAANDFRDRYRSFLDVAAELGIAIPPLGPGTSPTDAPPLRESFLTAIAAAQSYIVTSPDVIAAPEYLEAVVEGIHKDKRALIITTDESLE